MEQILLHLIGDYVLQSSWMANNKTKQWWPALVHAAVYSVPFLLICSVPAFCVILSTHALIDRFRLARFICWAKNFIGPGNASWSECSATGYTPDTPPFLAVWLMIITDNTLHLSINYLALHYL